MEEKDHATRASDSDKPDREPSNASHPYEENLNGTEERMKKDVELEGRQHLEREDSVESSSQIPWTFMRCVAIAACAGRMLVCSTISLLATCLHPVNLCACACPVTDGRCYQSGSQLVLYFVGGALTYIAQDLKLSLPQWVPNANLLGIAATLTFVGYFTDLIGRRWTVIVGAALLVLGSIVVSTAQNFVAALFGMTFAGIGAGICEMTSYAGVTEITTVKHRGMTIALVTVSIVPFCPYVSYDQLLEIHATWRWALGIAG